MRILAFTPFSSMYGGSNRSFLMVLCALKNKYGHEIKVIVPEKGVLCNALDENNICWELVSSHKIRGIYGKSIRSFLKLIRTRLYFYLDSRKAKDIISGLKEQYDLIYLNDCDPMIGAIVANKLKLPYVWHFRSLINPDIRVPGCIKHVYKNCSRFIAISNSMKALLEQNKYIPSGAVTTVYNGLPVVNMPRASLYDGGDFHMVLCGRLSDDKGHKDAIKALSYLRKTHQIKDVYLHIVGKARSEGEKEYEKILKELVANCGLDHQVVFEGQIEEMPRFRQKMHVELMCSVCEPFGRVTVEGMRSGLVVIGSNTGGTPEIISDGVTGLLYKQGDSRDLANKIQIVYKNPDAFQKLAKAGYSFGMTHFTEEENVNRVNSILMKAVRNRQ